MAQPLITAVLPVALAATTWLGGASAQTCQQAEIDPLAGYRAVEVRANTFTYNRQIEQSLDVDAEGKVLVAWGSRRQEHGTFGVFAQLFDPLGRPLGTEIHVNEYLPGNQYEPAVAFGPAGSAWIAWCSSARQDGAQGGIVMRRLGWSEVETDTGVDYVFQPLGDEIIVNETTDGDQQNATIVVDDLGNVTVAWVSAHEADRAVYTRRFDAFGAPLGSDLRVGEPSEGHESLPALALLDDNRVLAAWGKSDKSGRPIGIFARILTADGAPEGAPLLLNEEDGLQHVEPSIDADAEGNFVAAWMSAGAESEWGVSLRRFDRTGKALGDSELLPRGTETYRNGATVAVAPDGRHVVAYNVHDTSLTQQGDTKPTHLVSIHGVFYDAEGHAQGAPVRLNRFDDGEQNLLVGVNARHAIWTEHDQIALTWHGRIGEDKREVGLTLYAPEALDVPAPPMVEPVAAIVTREEVYAQKEAQPEWDPNWVPNNSPAQPPAGPDFGFRAFTSTGWTPPDPDLAVGPNHIVAVVNVDMRFFDKAGNQTFNTGLESWFGTSGFVFDPVALYDEHEDRYLVGAVEHQGSIDRFWLAVSDDNDPNGAWHKYVYNVDSICGFIDFPNLGMNEEVYSLTADCFSGQGNYIHVMEKGPMLNGTQTTRNSLRASTSLASNGNTRNYDVGTPAHYTVSAWVPGSPSLRIFAVENPATNPTLTSVNINVGSFSSPPDAQQMGTSNQADTIDTRIKHGVVRNGRLYCTHNVNGGDGAAKARWYEIDLNGWPASGNSPTLVQKGDIDPGNNIDTWFGDMNVTDAGDIAIAYNRSSPNEFIGVYRTYRLAGDPLNTMRPGVEMQTSTAPETGSRWGDYAGLEQDPARPLYFWNHHEYRESSWSTWVGEFTLDPNATDLIRLTGPTLVFKGATVTWTWAGGPPNEPWYLLWSRNGNGSTIMGHDFDIGLPINLAAQGTHAGDGTGSYTTQIPTNIQSGAVFWVEIGATSGSSVFDSNVLRTTVN